MIRVLVCGGRDYNNHTQANEVLGRFLYEQDEPITVVQGGARGADLLAKNWAERNKIPVDEYKPDWNKYGKAAGVIRNQDMLDTGIDYVIAFPGGRGTAHMVKISKRAGVSVLEV